MAGVKEFDSKAWTGEEREVPSLLSLIDKYLPTHTQAEVTAMAMRHEKQVHRLLLQIHRQHERMVQMDERMAAMEKEFYQQVKLPVKLGQFGVGVRVHPEDFDAKSIYVDWRPEPFRMAIRLAHEPIINDRDTPHLFEMVGRRFEEAATAELIPALRREYMSIYNQFKR